MLAAIFDKIGISNRWCCEFGAWDGEYLSNVYSLVKQGWYAVMIEGEEERYKVLKNKFGTNVHPVCAFVSDSGPNRLDNLLANTPIPQEFDVLSIDVDNDDYLIWDALRNYSPRVVIIEINSGLAPGVKKIPRRGDWRSPLQCGSSFTSTVELGKSKGYELAIHTGNCVFVRRDLAPLLDINPDNPDELFDPRWLNLPDEGIRAKGVRLLKHLAHV